ncbi:MAG: GNAT family N-acetyltransferase [Planctomycetaceae bacterium]|nr:GNAT family N-acetyltransferase [Planctomycetaceae bacterium]
MSQAARRIDSKAVQDAAAPTLSIYDGQRTKARAAGCEVEVWNSVGEIDVTLWNQIRDPDDIYMDVRLLRVVEETMARDGVFRYAIFRDSEGKPVAISCVCTYTIDASVLAEPGLTTRIFGAIKAISPALMQYRVVLCGLPFSGGQSHLRFAPGADHAAVLKALDGLLSQIAREDRAKCIVLKEFESHELDALEAVGQLGYRRADSLPMNTVRMQHSTIDDYLASMNGPRRRDFRKSQKKFEAAGLKMITTSDQAEIERLYTDEVHHMYEAVVSRSHTKFELLPPEFFREMTRRLPENCEFIFALENDHVLGFGLCLYSGHDYLPLFCGVDYERNRDYDLYFNMLYQVYANSLRHGVAEIRLGQNADQCKASRMGSFQTPRYFYVKGVGVIMQTVIRLLGKQLFPERPLAILSRNVEQPTQ